MILTFLGRKPFLNRPKRAGKVFFFARSPEAPRTRMMVLSLSSMVLSEAVRQH